MIIATVALLLVQQVAPSITWQDAAPVEPAAPVAAIDLPDWARADPFAYERARCSPLVRGETPLETCQAETRFILARALGDTLPAALRPTGAPDDCQMMREASGGSAYAIQCGAPPRDAIAAPVLQEQDCRPRPDQRGGFSTACRPTNPARDDEEGLKLKLWGED
jgi:hypothetical protein